MIRVQNTKFRDLLLNHEENEICYCEEEGKAYIWKNRSWEEVKGDMKASGAFTINKREFVMNMIKDNNPYDEENLKKLSNFLDSWQNKYNYEIVLAYGKEISYITMFIAGLEAHSFGPTVLECLANVGDIIYYSDYDKSIEIWIKTPEGLITEIYLFDYSAGIVPFNG